VNATEEATEEATEAGADHLFATVEALLTRLGLRVGRATDATRSRSSRDLDLLGHLDDGRSFVVVVKRLGTVRHEDLVGRLAVALLQAREHSGVTGAIPLVLVALPQLTSSAVSSATAFMNRHAPEVQWGLVSFEHGAYIHAPRLGVEYSDYQRARRHRGTPGPRAGQRLFTDLNCWMLKVLLLRDVEANWWAGPVASVSSIPALAQAANVSMPHAYRFAQTFQQADFLRVTPDGLTVVRREPLLRAWMEHHRLQPRTVMSARWTFGRPASLSDAFPVANAGEGLLPPRIAVAGFEACRAHGVLHTTVPGLEVHVEASSAKATFGRDLEPCATRDADVTLIVSRLVQSVFRGAVVRNDVRYVDILQAALDVSVHPARGAEQAEYVLGDVLGWFGRDG
jgi:hypothetical protein